MAEEHPFVQLARRSIESYITRRIVIDPPETLDADMARQAGAFVSLHRHGQLRGCIGTIEPVQANLAQEIITNAISASTRDPRFPAMRPEELQDLEISVDVLEPAEPISSLAELDPKTCGVIVQTGRRRGLLLPDLEGVDTPEQQVEIALHKAYIRPTEPYQMYRFCVTRYH